jgi:hypothetical protein
MDVFEGEMQVPCRPSLFYSPRIQYSVNETYLILKFVEPSDIYILLSFNLEKRSMHSRSIHPLSHFVVSF